MKYRHPVIGRPEWSWYCGIFALDPDDPDKFCIVAQGEVGPEFEVMTIKEFLEQVKKSFRLKQQMGIPDMTYHAYMFPRLGYNVDHVRNIVGWARGHDREVRVWVNMQSALLLVVVADPDVGEDSGWALYKYAKKDAGSYQSMGLASWFEYVAFGVPVPDGWELMEIDERLVAVSPDGGHFVAFS